ncbi:MAG: hypothetical protein SFU83_00510 [Meiothermus sp.]|nr:hypothetical protein [Meiothermus sp.]
MAERQAGGLEVAQDLEFEGRQWRAQLAGWWVMLLGLLLAVLGLLGRGGPLGGGRADGEGLSLEYVRLLHHLEPLSLEVRLSPQAPAAGGDRVRLALSQEWLAGVRLNAVTPQPESVELRPDRVIYTFSVAPGADRPAEVRFAYEAEEVGALRGWVELEGGGRVEFGQWVYP